MLASFRRIALGLALALPTFAAPAALAADKAYTREFLASEGVRLEAKIKGTIPGAKPLAQVRREADAAIQKMDYRLGAFLFGQALVFDQKDWSLWNGYARANAMIITDKWQERYDFRRNATTAAYLAYQKAATPADEATALATLGFTYQVQESWRSSLDAYRASLKARPTPAVQATWAQLREKYGFRLTDYTLDSDAASPRACFQFSEALARGKVDFAPYVVVSGVSSPAVTAEGAQLCVDGLEHGKRYSVVVRQGLPSSVEEELLKSSDYDFYIKDRSAQVHFTGKNYVLPRTGQEGLPVVSVNSKTVDVSIYRIGDRSLVPTIHGEDFLTNLTGYQATQLRDEKGVQIWQGKLDVATDLNKDVVTAFPVLQAVGKIEAGLYVMTARAGAKSSAGSDGDGDGDYESVATQWFVVSDLGLTAMSGSGGIDVLVRSLASAKPMGNVEVRLVARNNEVLQTRATDAAGQVKFDPGLARGTGGMAPAVVVAADGSGDYGFLDLKGEAFDLTDRGVEGRDAPNGLDAFVFTERGVYRTAETVNVTALLRDVKGKAVANMPVTLVVERPDGVEYRRELVADQGIGGRAWSVNLIGGVPTGTWRIKALGDTKRPPIGEATFLVEDYVAERVDVALEPKAATLKAGSPAEVKVTAKFLYGAPGADLEVSGSAQVSLADEATVPGLKGFAIGMEDETFESVTQELEETATTDEKGIAEVTMPLPPATSSRPLKAKISLTVSESGGRGVTRDVTLPILPAGPVIGVRKGFDEADLSAGAQADFDIVFATPEGDMLARNGLSWELKRVERRYQWFNSEGRWDYEVIRKATRVADGKVNAVLGAPARLTVPLDWGSYVLEVRTETADGPATSVAFSVGYGAKDSAAAPDVLDVKLDKASFGNGEAMKVHLAPRFAGTATVMVVSDHVETTQVVDVPATGATVSLPVSADWGTGAYALAIAHRPLDVAAHRMPGRAIGVAWFAIDEKGHKLDVSIDVPDMVRPRGPLAIPITIAGLSAGEEARVVVSAVDVGILNLTNYQTPDPEAHYNGQRLLGTEVRDLYGYLIDGMQGTRGTISSGGDGGEENHAPPPKEEPLSRYSGVVKVGADGKATVTFDLPAFNGTVRVMAVAWSASKVGHAEDNVIVRDPVVVTATVPRFLHAGDRSRLHMAIDNVEGQAGDYLVDLDVSGPLVISASAMRTTLKLAKGGKGEVTIPVTAGGLGTGVIEARLTGPGGIDARQTLVLKVNPATPAENRRSVQSLAGNGGSIQISSDLLADYIPGTGIASVSIAPLASFDAPALLKSLDRYPYGCSEQLVSRAMPLLYANKLAAAENLALDDAIDDRVKQTIDRLLARQDTNGTFGLWSVGGEDIWLTAYVADFLTRARERGFEVNKAAYESALDRLRNYVANSEAPTADTSHAIAYAAYVLARNGRPVIGDLRYLVDTKRDAFTTPLAQAQLGAALALLGDRGRSAQIFNASMDKLASQKDFTGYRTDYGTSLRDGAALIALMAESGAGPADYNRVGQLVADLRSKARYLSTQEQAWMVMAATALVKDADKLTLTVDGKEVKGAFYRSYRGLQLDGKPASIVNTSAAPATMMVNVSGNPVQALPEAANGYKIERTYHKLDGTKVDVSKVRQTDRLVVVLKITEDKADYADLMVVDNLPAGFEIDNPKLVGGTDLTGFDWLESSVEADHTEYRDDRFVATFNRTPTQSAFFHVAYMVRAVAPGTYVQPAATAEDMYRPSRFGRTATGTVEVTPAR